MPTEWDWPLLTADIPGAGGGFKAVPEDFVVEELPAYEPVGEGEHLFLWVQKRSTTTVQMVQRLAQHLGISPGEVGYAGLKDRQAVTRQYLSVPARLEAGVAGFAHPEIQILRAARHRNKLKSGHLRGNRFQIRLRDVRDPHAAQASFEALTRWGAPNYFGMQRFGRAGDNARWGRALLKGERLPRRPDRFARKLYLSAAQSELFNESLAARVRAGTLGTAREGDVLKKEDTGGEFVCTAPEVDQPRVERFEVSPAGPLFGPRMTAAAGRVAAEELAILEAQGLAHSDFLRGGDETRGARRPYRVRLGDAALSPEASDLCIQFELPAGSYATVVLREILKGEPLEGEPT